MKKRSTPGVLRVGTSNIVLPGTKRDFPAPFQTRSRLAYYATLFNSLEINQTFYKLPRAKTLLRWSTEVEPGFQFTVKLWKAITHAGKLQYKVEDADVFMQTLSFPAPYQGCLLIQFPGKISVDYFQKVSALLEQIASKNIASCWRLAVEFRHSSWYNAQSYKMLDTIKAALVLHDMPGSLNNQVLTNAPFIYMRFHGASGKYRGSYEPDYLDGVSVEAERWLRSGKDVYMYFNNTIGDAFRNAAYIRDRFSRSAIY